MANVDVLGAGGWGLALALNAVQAQHSVTVWSPFQEEIRSLQTLREHKKLLPGIVLPKEIEFTTDIGCVNAADVCVLAVPSTVVRATAAKLQAAGYKGLIVNVAKGLEYDTLYRLSQVIEEECPECTVVVLSGPSHAEEVARGIPTTVAVASKDLAMAQRVQELFMTANLRIYTNEDLLGVELGGALKNIIAVAAGMIDGLKMGDNTKAALVTRGLAEMSRLGIQMGADEKTFMGLTGLGDLVVTCTSPHSRNHRFGEMVGAGAEVESALQTVGTVEGYFAARSAQKLAEKYGVEMPITRQVCEVLFSGAHPMETLNLLMNRSQKSE